MATNETPQPNASSMIKDAHTWLDAHRNTMDLEALRNVLHNSGRVERIPQTVLPYGSAPRAALMALALRGHAVDAYVNDAGMWVIWCSPRRATGKRTARNGIYTVDQWYDAYQDIYAHIIAAQAAQQEGQTPA